jgi:glycosyltransferase involved in cell wall biosynthesis
MINGKSISLIIPCYNEEKGVEHLMKSLPESIDEVIVVDNNCTDRTAAVAKQYGAIVVEEKTPGYGSAYKCGMKRATNEIIVTMDGDGTYPVNQFEYLVKKLVDTDLEFISACRFPLADKKAMKRMNKIGNFVLTLSINILFFTKIKDSQTGMWIFYRSLLNDFVLKSNGMPFSEEIKLEAIKRKKRFAEIHIKYEDRLGTVKLNRWKDGFSNLLFIVKKRITG